MSGYESITSEREKLMIVRELPVEFLPEFADAHKAYTDTVVTRLREMREETLERAEYVKAEVQGQISCCRCSGHRTALVDLCDVIISIQQRIFEKDYISLNGRADVLIPLETRLLIQIYKGLKYLERSQFQFHKKSEVEMAHERDDMEKMKIELNRLYEELHDGCSAFTVVGNER